MEDLRTPGRWTVSVWIIMGLALFPAPSEHLRADVLTSDPGHESEPVLIAGWENLFAFHYDYVLAETAGLERIYEPVEVSLSVPEDAPQPWQDHIRVVRLEANGQGRIVPHQVLDPVDAGVQSCNVIFLARCPARSAVTYRLFWGRPEKVDPGAADLPSATVGKGLQVTGQMPALQIRNEYYIIRLHERSGAIFSVRRPGQDESQAISFRQHPPIHYGTDVWSPPEKWDHDYDWQKPPHQRCDGGTVALRYRRWGPLQSYRDVISSITYTFYAHVPYVHVSSTLEFTANRSTRAVRMGEIVVDHSPKPGSDQGIRDVFTHYAWPDEQGKVCIREVNRHWNAEGWAKVQGLALGALAILDRDVPWVAGYNLEQGRGMASLRKSQFVGNRLGGAIPNSAPCTYLSKYPWPFTYWSRPMVFPLGLAGTATDQNMAIAAGTIFATEEALLVFLPDGSLAPVIQAHRRFVEPLRFRYQGSGPW